MQKANLRQKTILGLFVSLILVAACAVSSFCLTDRSVSAETAYNYWHFTEGSGSYAVSLNSQATDSTTSYIGVETQVTRTDSTVKNMGVMLNGTVSPLYTSDDTGKTIIYYDNGDMSAPTADAVVVTFTSSLDMTKQVSIIGTVRNEKTYYTVALTDDITVQDGYALVNGKKTIGTAAITSEGSITGYTEDGFPMDAHRGAPYGGDASYYIGTDGIIYVSDWNKVADIDDETFLSMSKANLSGSEHEERYTAEYVSEILSSFETGCTMTITWYGLNVETVDFHMRGYTAYRAKSSNVTEATTFKWIDGGNVELDQVLFGPVFYQKINEVYKNTNYSLNDLIGAYTFKPDEESFKVWAFCDANGNNYSSTMLYKDNGTVSFTEDANMCVGGSYSIGYTSYPVYQYKVIEMPTATAKDVTLDVVMGDTCDLSQCFDFTCGTAAYTVAYSVAGVGVIQSPYTVPAAGTYTLTATITDKYGTTATAEKTITVKPCEVQYASLSLNGDIGLNFYAKLSSNETAPKANIGLADGTKTLCDGTYVEELALWKFSGSVAPKDYKKTVSFALTTYDGTEVTAEYSVETYLNNVKETESHYALCVKTKEYCEAARVYFNGETATETEALSADLSDYAGSVSGEDGNVTILGATLVLETKTSVRVYFKAENAEGPVCTIDGNTAEIKEENGFTYIEAADIAVKDLGEMHEFAIGGITVNYGAISYVQSVANATENVALDNVVKALYNAFVVGAEYFKAN